VTAAAGPYLAACWLLVAAGATKLARPDATRRSIAAVAGRAAGAVPEGVVKAGALAECVLGAVGMTSGTARPALAVALCYLAFAAFVAISNGRGAGAGCGCFGAATADVPLGPLHLVVDLGLAASALAVGLGGGLGGGAERVAVAMAGAGLAWVVYLVLVPLPRLLVDVRETTR
jgi:hypothetical protein